MVIQESKHRRISIGKIHKDYIKYTKRAEVVRELTAHLCNMTAKVYKEVGFDNPRIYLTTRTLKHLYDKRPAQEYDYLLKLIPAIIRFPDIIYLNKSGKRGSKCFVKTIEQIKYFSVIEQVIESKENYLVTAFTIDEIYLKGYKEIWRWEGDNLHRNDLDATKW